MAQSHTITLVVEAHVVTDIPRIYEVLSRASAGLILDGIESVLMSSQDEETTEVTDREESP